METDLNTKIKYSVTLLDLKKCPDNEDISPHS